MKHTSEISYTAMDNGIWIDCNECHRSSPSASEEIGSGKSINISALGFFPTVDEVMSMWKRHLDGEW